MISDETYQVIVANAARLDSAVIYDRDFSYVRLLHLSHRSALTATTARITLASRPSSVLTS